MPLTWLDEADGDRAHAWATRLRQRALQTLPEVGSDTYVTRAYDLAPRRGWTFVSAGLGDADLDGYFRTLNQIGYTGPISIEWEDSGMDRLHGAPLALTFAREHVYDLPDAAFDSHFDNR